MITDALFNIGADNQEEKVLDSLFVPLSQCPCRRLWLPSRVKATGQNEEVFGKYLEWLIVGPVDNPWYVMQPERQSPA